MWIIEEGVNVLEWIIRDNYKGEKLLISGTELFSKNILSDIKPLIESRS